MNVSKPVMVVLTPGALTNVREAIELYLEDMDADGEEGVGIPLITLIEV